MGTHLFVVGQQEIEVSVKYFEERIHGRPIEGHCHITANIGKTREEMPDDTLTHVQRVQDDINLAADATKYCSKYHTTCNITARGKTG